MTEQTQDQVKLRCSFRATFFESADLYLNPVTNEYACRPVIWRSRPLGDGYNVYEATPARIQRLLSLANNPASHVIVEIQNIRSNNNVILAFSTINQHTKQEYFEFLAKIYRLRQEAASQKAKEPEPQPAARKPRRTQHQPNTATA